MFFFVATSKTTILLTMLSEMKKKKRKAKKANGNADFEIKKVVYTHKHTHKHSHTRIPLCLLLSLCILLLFSSDHTEIQFNPENLFSISKLTLFFNFLKSEESRIEIYIFLIFTLAKLYYNRSNE